MRVPTLLVFFLIVAPLAVVLYFATLNVAEWAEEKFFTWRLKKIEERYGPEFAHRIRYLHNHYDEYRDELMERYRR